MIVGMMRGRHRGLAQVIGNQATAEFVVATRATWTASVSLDGAVSA
jgi:hypothetical protein